MPALAIAVPTLKILPTITTTVQISLTVVIGAVGTLQAGLQTPAAMVSTAGAQFSYASGQNMAATVQAGMTPALSWLALVNPMHPQWQIEGGPLWALAPLLQPISPIIAMLALVVVWQLAIALVRFALILADWLVKIIELIPGM
jgi:hypothetical protein